MFLGEGRYLGILFNSTLGTFVLALGIAFISLSCRSVFAVSAKQPLPCLVQRRGVQNEDLWNTVLSILATFYSYIFILRGPSSLLYFNKA